MPHRLIIALTLSLVLHGGLLLAGAPGFPAPPRPPALRALLRPPLDPERLPPPSAAESLLKNTLEDETPEKPVATALPPPPEARGTPAASAAGARVLEAVRKKLSEYVFYPEQARRLGIEGTVTLFVELAADGRVEDVRVVESSGHAILDNAAVKGFYALGRFPGESGLWDYTFQLE
ncbi:MAG: energy transducer TonB [Planctomycetota bacterium]|jgi:protein TonB|nr:energy transducer TonB [Planctomycetota bacterium]